MIRIVQIPDNIPEGFRDLPDEFIEAADEKVDHVEGEGSLRGYTLPATALVRVLPPELTNLINIVINPIRSRGGGYCPPVFWQALNQKLEEPVT